MLNSGFALEAILDCAQDLNQLVASKRSQSFQLLKAQKATYRTTNHTSKSIHLGSRTSVNWTIRSSAAWSESWWAS